MAQMLNFFTSRRPMVQPYISRVTIIAVNILARIPIPNVTANPLMGPVPKWYNTNATANVVTFASSIVQKARWYPLTTADHTVLPVRSSSRMRSKYEDISVNSYTDCQDKSGKPGQC